MATLTCDSMTIKKKIKVTYEVKVKPAKTVTCSICEQKGHNKASCNAIVTKTISTTTGKSGKTVKETMTIKKLHKK